MVTYSNGDDDIGVPSLYRCIPGAGCKYLMAGWPNMGRLQDVLFDTPASDVDSQVRPSRGGDGSKVLLKDFADDLQSFSVIT